MYEGRLIVEGAGNWAFTVWLRDQDAFTIGRSSDCDIHLQDGKCSKTHAAVVLENGNYRLEDRDSRNGTYVNGARIQSQPLRNRDEIRIGESLMSFLDDSDIDASAASFVALPLVDPQAPKLSDPLSQSLSKLSDSVSGLQGGTGQPSLQPAQIDDLGGDLREIQRSIQALNYKSTLLGIMAGSGPFPVRMRKALNQIATDADAENGFIMFIDPDSNKWVVRCRFGDIADWQDKQSRPLSLSIVKETVGKKKTVFSDDMYSDERFAGQMSVMNLEIKAAISVPIVDGAGEVRGVVYVDRRKKLQSFSEDDTQRLETFAEVIATVHGNQ